VSSEDGVAAAPLVLERAAHPISRKRISESAIKVLYRLHRSGFLAYMVGGAVRDLLLNRRPKDFDIGTNARPQQVRQLFRNARLIGRRFRLARVAFGTEIVEVATFRRSPEPPEMEDGETADVLAEAPEVDEYGTPHEDALRRDFTVNGLFYNVADFTVIDHVNGLADLRAGVIRTIGPARGRFGEDPVRMMRAVEYAARLGFRLDDELAEALDGLHGEIHRAAPARIGYELGESLKGGQALPIFRGLEEHGLLLHIVPEAHAALSRRSDGLLWRLLAVADQAVRRGDRVPEEALLGTLFLPVRYEGFTEPELVWQSTGMTSAFSMLAIQAPRRRVSSQNWSCCSKAAYSSSKFLKFTGSPVFGPICFFVRGSKPSFIVSSTTLPRLGWPSTGWPVS